MIKNKKTIRTRSIYLNLTATNKNRKTTKNLRSHNHDTRKFIKLATHFMKKYKKKIILAKKGNNKINPWKKVTPQRTPKSS